MGIKDLMGVMNYNLSRNTTGKSKLAEIQIALIDLFLKQPNLTVEQIKDFESKLFTNSEMFDKKVDYSSLNMVDPYFKERYEYYKQINIDKDKTM